MFSQSYSFLIKRPGVIPKLVLSCYIFQYLILHSPGSINEELLKIKVVVLMRKLGGRKLRKPMSLLGLMFLKQLKVMTYCLSCCFFARDIRNHVSGFILSVSHAILRAAGYRVPLVCPSLPSYCTLSSPSLALISIYISLCTQKAVVSIFDLTFSWNHFFHSQSSQKIGWASNQ